MKHFTKPLLVTTSILFLFAFIFIFTKTPAKAATGSNPIFATIQYVNDAINAALSQNSTKSLKVYDANGHELGILVNHNNLDSSQDTTNTIYSTSLRRFMYVNEISPYFNGFTNRIPYIFYQSSDCTGTAYDTVQGTGHDSYSNDVLPFNPTTNYIFNDSEAPSTVNLGSRGYYNPVTNQFTCDPYITTGTTAYDLHPVNLPFPTPIAFPLQFKYQ